MKKLHKLLTVGALALALVGVRGQAEALVLPDPFNNGYLYGDFHSYSLPLLAYNYFLATGVGTTSGNNPFYIQASPGQLAGVVLGIGVPNTGNFPGMDDAYRTPNPGGGDTFSTGTVADPGGSGQFDGDMGTTWDARLSALTSFLKGSDLVVLFNNNESGTNGDVDLFAWAQVKLWNSLDSNVSPIYFDFTNDPQSGQPGGNPADYTSPSYTDPTWVDNLAQDDFVLSGSDLCVDDSGSLVPCGSASVEETLSHNLGTNIAAYALTSLELNEFLKNWDAQSLFDVMSVDVRMNELSNGYETIFLTAGTILLPPPPPAVPEPSTLVLLGGGLVGLGLLGYRRRK